MRSIPLLTQLLLACPAVLSLLLLQPTAAATRDESHSRLVAFADLHGDVHTCRLLLRAANITDDVDHWIAGTATVIQLGDIADRGRHSHEIYDLFTSLEKQAVEAGGEFIFIIGNHELMNLVGDHAYAHPDMVGVFGGSTGYSAAFSPNGAYGSYILEHQVVVVRGCVVFTHGGITPLYAAKGVDRINAEFHDGFNCNHRCDNGGGNPFACHPFNKDDSPLWSRQLVYEAQSGDCGSVAESLRLLSAAEQAAGRPPVHAMVVGHTTQPDGNVGLLCGGRLIAADVGLSRYAFAGGGYVAFVEFPPPQRGATPQYPYGRGEHPLVGEPLTQKIHPPLRLNRPQKQEQQQVDGHGPKRAGPVVGVLPPSVDVPPPPPPHWGKCPRASHTYRMSYVFLCIPPVLMASLFALKTWKPLKRSFRRNLGNHDV